MTAVLFADGASDDGPGFVVLVAGLVVLVLVLRWLHRIGFYGKALRALGRSAFVLGGVALGVIGIAAVTGEADALAEFIDRNADGVGVCVVLWCVVGVAACYERGQKPAEKEAVQKDGRSCEGRREPRGADRAEQGSDKTNVPPSRTAAAPAGRCVACRGRGESVETCSSCCGSGEHRCTNEFTDKFLFWSDTLRCEGGRLVKFQSGVGKVDAGACPDCNGRGFYRCSSCRGRGDVSKKCEQCGGTGED